MKTVVLFEGQYKELVCNGKKHWERLKRGVVVKVAGDGRTLDAGPCDCREQEAMRRSVE